MSKSCSRLLLLHGNPDLAVVVLILGAVLELAGIAVQLHIDACGNLIVRVRGQPLGEDLLVQPLERLGHPAGAGEHRPGVGRDGAGGEAIRDLPGGIVVVGDEIFKLISAHALVQVDAVYAAHHLAAACGEVLRPELGDLGYRVLILA